MIKPARSLDAVGEVLRSADLLGELRGRGDITVLGVCQDSREAQAGDLFLAWKGSSTDAHDFVAEAIANGAVAVIVERPVDVDVPQLVVADGRRAAALAARAVIGAADEGMFMVGVTGTNGKTTTTHLLAQLLPGEVGTIGTMGVRYGGVVSDSPNTTPGPTALRRALRSMVDAGCSACVMEVSSHALDQRRADGLRFAGAVYTNLTQDHLDYHGTMIA